MKTLITLAVIQTALLTYLISTQGLSERRPDAALPITPPTAAPQTPAVPPEPQDNRDGLLSESDARLLRQIVREELALVRTGTGDFADTATDAADEPTLDAAELQYRRDAVAAELEYLKRQSEVSHAEMQELLGAIARLDPEGRSEMLKEVNRAMNHGEIKSNL